MEPLVSIIMPSYNAERHIAEAIRSVQAQTLPDWELLVTDDCSFDSTRSLVVSMAGDDPRVSLFTMGENSGAAAARNNSLEHARGRYVAYLDADDLWYPGKLERQVSFMEEHSAAFSCASYEVIDGNGMPLGRSVHMRQESDYRDFLRHNLIQTVGVMADLHILDRSLLVMPPLRRCEDAATWLQVLKAGYKCYGIDDILCGYRRVEGSLSSGKLDGARSIWNLYRNVEHLPFCDSLVYFTRYALLAVWKRTYRKWSRQQETCGG